MWINTHRPAGRGAAEVLAVAAILNVEGQTDDRKEHRVGAVQQVTVDDRVKTDVGRNRRRSTGVPAQTVTIFGGVGHWVACGSLTHGGVKGVPCASRAWRHGKIAP